jgi:hypothetical protein
MIRSVVTDWEDCEKRRSYWSEEEATKMLGDNEKNQEKVKVACVRTQT